MIEKLKEALDGLQNVNRAKTQDAIDGRRRRIKFIKEHYQGHINLEQYKLLDEYLIDCNLKEIEIIKNQELNEISSNILLSEKDRVRMRRETLDKYQRLRKEITDKKYSENTEINAAGLPYKNSINNVKQTRGITDEEDAVMNELLSSESIAVEVEKWEKKDEKLDELFDGIYIQGVHPVPPYVPPVVRFMGEAFVTEENISTIVASPGTGKSSICESILASMLNPKCDSLGFSVDDRIETALFIDTERDHYLVNKSTDRMKRRAFAVTPPKRKDKEQKTALIIAIRKQNSVEAKKKKIIALIEYYNPQLLLIDGISDLVKGTNSEDEANIILGWCMDLQTKYKLAIITTIHPNYGSDKARGWLGSELLRKDEGVLFVKENADESKTISSTKARDSKKLRTSYKWCDELMYNVSCDNPTTGVKKQPPIIEALTESEIEKMKSIHFIPKEKRDEFNKNIEYKEFQFKQIETELKAYMTEEHPNVNSGTNKIGQFIKDLTENKHMIKRIASPYNLYSFVRKEKE